MRGVLTFACCASLVCGFAPHLIYAQPRGGQSIPESSLSASAPESAPDPQVSTSALSALWSMSAKVGVHFFLTSQSNAIPHRVKPMFRLGVSRAATSRLRIGAEFTLPAELDANYRLVGGWLNVAYGLYRGALYQADVLAGAGLGSNPPILHQRLTSRGGVAFWHQVHLQQRWRLTPRYALGFDLGYENSASALMMVALRYQWGDTSDTLTSNR